MLPEDAFDSGPLSRGPYTFVADARVDNRADLGRALGMQQADLCILSDSALLFETFLRWGEEAADKIVGEFAFALWDGQRERLTLGRDILGDRPLYLHRSRGFVAFATMPSGLHALEDIPKEVDFDFVAEQVALLPQTGSATCFKHLDRIEPAHLVHVDAAGINSQRYWTPQPPAGRRRSPAEYEEELRAVFGEAVRSQLRGAGPIIGTHLSGGLDSATVTATAALERPESRVAAFTAVPRRGFDGPVPPGRVANEGEQAAALVRRFPNVDHVLVESGGSPLDGLDREHFFQQQPIGNLCNAVWGRRINKAAHERGAKVLLTGDCGNMTISYAGLEWLSELFQRGRLFAAAGLATALARNGMPVHSVGAQMIGPLLPQRLWSSILKLSGRSDYITDATGLSSETLDRVIEKAQQRAVDLTFRPFSDPFDLRVHVLTAGDGGNWVKGVLAEWGLSLRSPTADKRVIELCLSIPPREYIRDGVPRSLARRAFADRLPPEILLENRRGYQSADWFEGISENLAEMRSEVAAIKRNGAAADVLDFAWLEESMATFPTTNWETDPVTSRYRHGFLRAISAGHFMRKVAGTN
jgi:asparagine synthase (glutamine-hydrolysing)